MAQCYICKGPIAESFTVNSENSYNDQSWCMINIAPWAAGGGSMVCIHNKCKKIDPQMQAILNMNSWGNSGKTNAWWGQEPVIRSEKDIEKIQELEARIQELEEKLKKIPSEWTKITIYDSERPNGIWDNDQQILDSEMFKWCANYFGGEMWRFYYANQGLNFEFKNIEDAELFKLTWIKKVENDFLEELMNKDLCSIPDRFKQI